MDQEPHPETDWTSFRGSGNWSGNKVWMSLVSLKEKQKINGGDQKSRYLVKSEFMFIILNFCCSYWAHSFLSHFEVGLRLSYGQEMWMNLMYVISIPSLWKYPIYNLLYSLSTLNDLRPHIADDSIPNGGSQWRNHPMIWGRTITLS